MVNTGLQATLFGDYDFLKPVEVILMGPNEVFFELEEVLTGAGGFLRRREGILKVAEDYPEEAKESLGTPEEILGGANEILIVSKTAVIKQKVKIKLKPK